MLLDVDIGILQAVLKTDGQEIWWKDFPPPKNLRGIHIQEIQDLFILHGKCLFPIEKFPASSPSQDQRYAKLIYDPLYAIERFFVRLIGNQAILIYESHAKVLDFSGAIYDPSSPKISKISVREIDLVHEAWLVGEIKSGQAAFINQIKSEGL
jgi:hypothetical protein